MKNPINFFDGEILENELWFSNLNYNALMKTSLLDGTTEIISAFPDAEPEDINLHIRVIRYESLLFFIPYSGCFVQVWNTEKKCFEESIRLDCEEECKWANAYKDEDDRIWIIPDKLFRPFAIVNAKTGKAERKDMTAKIGFPSGFTTGTKCVEYYDNGIYIQGYRSNLCFRVDCRSEQVQRYNFPEGCMITFMRNCGEQKFYMELYGNPNLYEWDMTENAVSEYGLGIPVVKGRNAHWDVAVNDKKILLVPCNSDDLMLFDTETNSVDKINLTEKFQRTSPYALFGFYKQVNEKVYLFPRACNRMVIVDMQNGLTSEIPFLSTGRNKEYSDELIKSVFEKWYTLEMSEVFAYSDTLDLFLNKMISEQEVKESCSDSNVGEEIHRYIKERIK